MAKKLGNRYTVQDRIGTGGMAVVYRGIDEVLGRTVAIKTMLPQYAADPSFAARFKQEAQAAGALNSPYIVSVYDWGKDEDTYYIVMEYLRGTDLKSGIRKHGALDNKKVAQIGSQVALALSEAHRHEIIHRDIKPQNIMVLRDGNIKVMDFGIARAKNSHLTQDNSVLGTAHYVSPEQTQGKPLGPTTDIYSLGIVMYEAATGKVPFEGDDAISVALKQVNEQPKPPSQINPNVDPSLESIILKCMQKDPKARFQTADELYQVLRDYMAGRLQAVNAVTSVIPAATTTVRGATKTTVRPKAVRPTTGDTTTTQRPQRPGQTAQELRARQQQEEERTRKRARRRRLAIIGIVALLGVVAAALAAALSGPASPKTQSVPNLLNLTQTEALKQIADSDFFERGEVTTTYSTTVEKGRVISQTPEANSTAEEGTKIDLVISDGEEPKATVSVPDLRGMTPSEAQEALKEVGLVGESGDSVYDETVENGRVASQDPVAGSWATEGDTITYHLSKGGETVNAPNMIGTYLTEATATLESLGFTCETSYDYSDTYGKDIVIDQSPQGNAAKGATISLKVSLGSSTVEVPNVLGMTRSQAEATLAEAGFSVSVLEKESDEAAGIVIDQTPYGSIGVDSKRAVTIAVSTGPAPDPTPEPDTKEDEGGTSETSETGDTTDETAGDDDQGGSTKG